MWKHAKALRAFLATKPLSKIGDGGWSHSRWQELLEAYQWLLTFHGGNATEAQRADVWALMRMAAEQGHAIAQFSLGICYHKGVGVRQNSSKAARFRMAAEQGDAEAQYYLGGSYSMGR